MSIEAPPTLTFVTLLPLDRRGGCHPKNQAFKKWAKRISISLLNKKMKISGKVKVLSEKERKKF